MKKILIATDFSAPANNALDYAANLAQKVGSDLVIFSVYTMSIHASNSHASATLFKELMKKDEDKLINLGKEIEEKFNIDVKTVFMTDDVISSLKKYLKAQPVDLVVMGIESNLTEYKLFGNTTTDAIKMRQFPLLVVPNDVKFSGYKNIVYACDHKNISKETNLNVLKHLVDDFNAELNVLNVLKEKDSSNKITELEEKMNVILKDFNHSYNYVHNATVGDGVKEALDKYPAELLVMIPHKIGFFESLIKGSQTSQMTIKTRVPLLIIPNDLKK